MPPVTSGKMMFVPATRGELVVAGQELRHRDQRDKLLECIELGDLGRPDRDVGSHGLDVGQAAPDGICQAERDRMRAGAGGAAGIGVGHSQRPYGRKILGQRGGQLRVGPFRSGEPRLTLGRCRRGGLRQCGRRVQAANRPGQQQHGQHSTPNPIHPRLSDRSGFWPSRPIVGGEADGSPMLAALADKICGIDPDPTRHARADAVLVILRLGESQADREALDDADEVAGSVVGREEGKD